MKSGVHLNPLNTWTKYSTAPVSSQAQPLHTLLLLASSSLPNINIMRKASLEGDSYHSWRKSPSDMLPATYDSEDQEQSCNKLNDFGLHRLDPQSSFLAPSVWVLVFFSFLFFIFLSCTDFGHHRLDSQSFFLALSVWVLGFFFFFFHFSQLY